MKHKYSQNGSVSVPTTYQVWVSFEYFCMSTLGVPKKKKLNTLLNKHKIINICSLVLHSINPLVHLSFILFWFQY